jgi:hypothetical protein
MEQHNVIAEAIDVVKQNMETNSMLAKEIVGIEDIEAIYWDYYGFGGNPTPVQQEHRDVTERLFPQVSDIVIAMQSFPAMLSMGLWSALSDEPMTFDNADSVNVWIDDNEATIEAIKAKLLPLTYAQASPDRIIDRIPDQHPTFCLGVMLAADGYELTDQLTAPDEDEPIDYIPDEDD